MFMKMNNNKKKIIITIINVNGMVSSIQFILVVFAVLFHFSVSDPGGFE